MPATSVADYVNLPKNDTVWVWNGIVPSSGSILLFGRPKLGKSLLALGLCEAVADGAIAAYLGQEIQQHGKVLYLQLDTPRSLWGTNYLEVVKSEEARKNIYIIDREMEDLPKMFDIRSAASMTYLRKEIDRIEPVLTIVDTIRRMHRGKENDSDVMAEVHDAFQYATKPSALGYISHAKKPQVGDGGQLSNRGSDALAGAVDGLVGMSKKGLHIEARSPIDEDIPIFQNDNGTFSVDTDGERKTEFIVQLDPSMPKMKMYEMIMDEFKCSLSTARRLVKYTPRPSQ